jgi:hypothetical protein
MSTDPATRPERTGAPSPGPNPARRASAGLSARDLAFGGLFGAAALLLPVVFHALQLGRAFMPMYLPLVALGFLVGPRVAVTTAVAVPLLSAAVTGMPPLYPPIAPVMALELGFMAGCIALVCRGRPGINPWLVLVPVLAAGRVLNVGLMYAAAWLLDLPAQLVAGLSLLAGWPGIVLMLVVVPPLVRVVWGTRGAHAHG